MPSAREAAIERTAEVLHWRGEGEKITWAEQLEQATPGTWGVVEFYREWAAEVVSALLAPSEERCIECGGTGEVEVDVRHTSELAVAVGMYLLDRCPVCSGSGKRSSAPLIVETLIETRVIEQAAWEATYVCPEYGSREEILLEMDETRLCEQHPKTYMNPRPLFRISPSSTSEES